MILPRACSWHFRFVLLTTIVTAHFIFCTICLHTSPARQFSASFSGKLEDAFVSSIGELIPLNLFGLSVGSWSLFPAMQSKTELADDFSRRVNSVCIYWRMYLSLSASQLAFKEWLDSWLATMAVVYAFGLAFEPQWFRIKKNDFPVRLGSSVLAQLFRIPIQTVAPKCVSVLSMSRSNVCRHYSCSAFQFLCLHKNS